MNRIWTIHRLIPITVSLLLSSCAYFNTFYNAEKYFREADLIRLEKSDRAIPLRAMDNYGKTIQKCKVVLSDFPGSRYVNDAILLMAKAQFYRSEYDNAISNLKIIYKQGSLEQIAEAKYWSAVCKWKKGKTQTAIEELQDIIKSSKNNELIAQSHLSLADIYLNEDQNSNFLFHLEEGAKVIKDRAKKGIVYNQLADIAFNNEKYDVAESAYKEVIKNSLAKDKIENAHIQILKISRLAGDYRIVERKIKSMLVDDKFKNIKGNLELELVKLYVNQEDIDNALVRLESIINDYPRTPTSAEAYYIMGQIYLSEQWNPSLAKEKFIQVKKEYGRSEFGPFCDSKINAIEKYADALTALKQHQVKQDSSLVDSSLVDSIGLKKSNSSSSIEELLYLLGDLEAFSFDRVDSGIVYFEKIIEQDSFSSFVPKSIFTLAMIYQNNGDSLMVNKYKTLLQKNHPRSDYTSYLFKKVSKNTLSRPIEKLFFKAEKLWSSNPVLSMELFKDVLYSDSLSELSASAAYFLGYQYDYNFAQLDSAFKYYSWLNNKHPFSEQNNSAKYRIKVIENMISESKNDSTNTVN